MWKRQTSDRIIFRDLPGIAEIESQYGMYADNRLFSDEREALERAIDAKSLELFGITEQDTSYWELLCAQYDGSEEEWERHFEFFYEGWEGQEEAFWEYFGIDVTDGEGTELACLYAFARQLICALRGLHPKAFLNVGQAPQTDQQIQAAAEAWGRRLLGK